MFRLKENRRFQHCYALQMEMKDFAGGRLFMEGCLDDEICKFEFQVNDNSTWWKYLISLEKRLHSPILADNINLRLGNGVLVLFRKGIWIREQSFKGLFPDLFCLSSMKDENVACMGRRSDNV